MPNSAQSPRTIPLKPKISLDWTINFGDVITVVMVLMIGVTAYFDVKSDQRDLKTRTEQKFSEYDKLWVMQKDNDDQQNQRLIRIYAELQAIMRDNKNEIKGDIRELRTDLAVRGRR